MTESYNPTPNPEQEYYLGKEGRIKELKEKLRLQAASHLDLLRDKGLTDDPRHLLGAHADNDVRDSREENWKIQTELLGLDRDALIPPDPEGPRP